MNAPPTLHLEDCTPEMLSLLRLADRWWYCGGCRYVARDYPFSDHDREAAEYDDSFPPCPACEERWWMSVAGLGRAKRWAFVVAELPNRAARARAGGGGA